MNTDLAPSPELFFNTLTAYQKTAALKASIELDVFTAIAKGAVTVPEIAQACRANDRGIRILCDYLTIHGFLQKAGDQYSLTPDTAIFLSRQSPAYSGGIADFLVSEHLTKVFGRLTEAVRHGGTSDQGSIAPEHPIWLTFAESMGVLMAPAAAGLAEIILLDPDRPSKVLDVSASHGVWGIAFAKKNPLAQLVALDWAPVLEIATRNATAAGLADRFSTLTGNALEVDLDQNYDLILVPNFLHHFNAADCVRFLKRCRAALRPGGKVAVVEFVPNSDRVTPPPAAAFSLVMLASTPSGDAYTFEELGAMLTEAGFETSSLHPLPASMNVAVIAART